MKRLLVGLTAALLMVLSVSSAALAAPVRAPNASPPAVVTCGSDIFTVVTMGNGGFTPGHVIGSTTVLIPVAFGGTDVYANGVLVEQQPGISKGSAAPQGHPLIWCTFAQGSDFEGIHYDVVGSVKVFILR